MDIRIIVLQRGWVSVGIYSNDGMMGRLERSATIRRWGTRDKGLGHLAKHGPQPETVLDYEGTQRFHELAVIKHIDCDAEVWAPVLEGLSHD
jgi:hypothetical protein